MPHHSHAVIAKGLRGSHQCSGCRRFALWLNHGLRILFKCVDGILRKTPRIPIPRLIHSCPDERNLGSAVSVKTGKSAACEATRAVIARAPGYGEFVENRARPSARNQGTTRMQGFDIETRNRIVALVKAILDQNSVSVELHPETRLVDIGLTSKDMVNLMLAIEAEFDFMIPQHLITPENFQSVATLERLVAGQLRTQQAA